MYGIGITAPGEKPPPSLLSLLPLPPTEAAAGAAGAGAAAQHPARLVLMHADGTEPIEFVVHLSPEVTGAELLAQAASLASLDGAEEQLVIFSADTYVPRPGSKELATCRLRTWVAGAQSEHNSLRYGRQMCGHSEESLGQKLRPGTRLANTFSTFYATRLPQGRWVAVFLRKLGVRTITHKRARDVRAFGPSSELVTKSPFGCICILPAPEAMGGMKAEKELQASLRAFLAPFLAPEAEYEPPDLFHVADATGMWEEALAHWHVAGNSNAEVSYRTARVRACSCCALHALSCCSLPALVAAGAAGAHARLAQLRRRRLGRGDAGAVRRLRHGLPQDPGRLIHRRPRLRAGHAAA